MEKLKLFNLLEQLENKFVFKFSWVYFWVLVAISILGIITSTLFILYGISPTIKGRAPKFKPPEEVRIALKDVENALKPPEEKPPVPIKEPEKQEPPQEKKTAVKEESPEEIKLKEKLEGIKALFPEPQYRWETTYKKVCTYSWGRECYNWEVRVDKRGIKDTINSLLKPHKSPSEKIAVLDEMIEILKAFPEETRRDALSAYSKLRREREKERKEKLREIQSAIDKKISENEMKYDKAKAQKAIARRIGLSGFAFSAATIAFLGLSLVLFSIERTLKDIKSTLEKNEKN